MFLLGGHVRPFQGGRVPWSHCEWVDVETTGTGPRHPGRQGGCCQGEWGGRVLSLLTSGEIAGLPGGDKRKGDLRLLSRTFFCIVIQIRWKIWFTVILFLAMILLRNFAHGTTALLSCHVQNCLVISVAKFTWEQNVISFEFELRMKKKCMWNGPLGLGLKRGMGLGQGWSCPFYFCYVYCKWNMVIILDRNHSKSLMDFEWYVYFTSIRLYVMKYISVVIISYHS